MTVNNENKEYDSADSHVGCISIIEGPLEFVEPDLSSLLANRPLSPEPVADKKDTPNEKQRQGRHCFCRILLYIRIFIVINVTYVIPRGRETLVQVISHDLMFYNFF